MEDEALLDAASSHRQLRGRGLASWIDQFRYMMSAWNRTWRGQKIEELEQIAEPGDILLFRGRGLIALAQELCTGGDVSHVAIVARYKDELGYFEADRHRPARNDLEGCSAHCAIHFVPFRLGIETYLHHDGLDVSLRKLVLRIENSDAKRQEINDIVVKTALNYRDHDVPFDSDVLTFVNVAYPWLAITLMFVRWLGNARHGPLYQEVMQLQRMRGIYCSEFVTLCFIQAGLFASSADPRKSAAGHKIAPVHFTLSNEPALTSVLIARTAMQESKKRFGALPWRHADQFCFGLAAPIFVR